MSIFKKIIAFIPNKLISINKSVDKIISFPESTEKTFVFVTKLTGVTTGAAGVAKGSVDLIEAIACQDGICAAISGIGVLADSLQICASFIPGPNVTSLVTAPISVGCKVFVWCCKRSIFTLGSC
jgi:hypothetical protein